MTLTTFNVPGIASDHCARIVEDALAALEPVSAVSADVTGRQVTVTFDSSAIRLLELADALADAGYPADSIASVTEERPAVWSCCSPSARPNAGSTR